MKLKSIRHHDQTFTYTDHTLTFPSFATDALHRALVQWQKVFPREETLIQMRHDVPSLFVRFDCVISPAGDVRIYELQEGCAWVGYTGIANSAFRGIRDRIVQEEWPHLRVLRSDKQTDKDDDLWLSRSNITEALRSPDPLMVRSNMPLLAEELRTIIIRKSVRPVMMHNDKSYGEALGWWRVVDWEESSHGEEKIPWHEAFVLKPRFGFGSSDIMLWNPHNRVGRATRTQVLRVLKRRGTMYLQPYIPPMHMDIDGTPYNFIYRPYFIYSGKQKQWVPAHGIWTARPHPALRIHGASDAISGPLKMQ